MDEKTIWAFDLGKGSIGEAVRRGDKFLHTASLLIPADFAETKTAAERRRMSRTREAHKAREQWLDEVMQQAGIEPLKGRRTQKVDGKWQSVPETEAQRQNRELLEREFAKPGDPTCYTSCLLRIKLLRGDEKLEPWQIYKALHSAVQKRGYGKVPWAAQELKRSGKTEEEIQKELAKKDPAYKAAVEAWPKFKQEFADSRFHFPCYYDAAKMGLWEADVLQERINCHAQSTRRVRFDRDDVEKEISALANQAAKQLPQIQKAFETIKANGWMRRSNKNFPVAANNFGEFLVYGPAGEPPADANDNFGKYLAFRKKRSMHPGSTDDWMGATAQKIPRFDNRIVNACALLDGLQVCNVGIRYDAEKKRPYPDSLLASEVTFLMKLKHTLVSGTAGQRRLTLEEIQMIFKTITDDALAIAPDAKDWSKKVAERYALTKTAWGSKKGIKELGLRPLVGHEVIKSPKVEGRSRFSRPALRLIRALILSGQKPSEFRYRLLAREKTLLDEISMDVRDTEPTRNANGATNFVKQSRPWILTKHLKFLEDLGRANDTWEAIHIPEQRLDALQARHTADDGNMDKRSAIRELLGNINDPVVRHRLGVFAHRLEELHKAHGIPTEIALEFIREDFMGEQAKRDLQKFQTAREKSRKEAKEKAAEFGASEKSGSLKYELFMGQSCMCLYCGQTFAETDLDDYEIDHIVPRRQGGPDAMVNYVLAHIDCNDKKGEQTPFQWKHGKEGWNGYETIVKQHAVALRNKKVQLLLREDASELVQRYTAMAETAWISKLAQTIISLHFGWRNGIDYREKNPVKRVTVISGGLTGRIRRKYRLNSLLNPAPPGTLDLNEWEANAEKNRADDRHHALDAMIISFLPAWARDTRKEHFFRFPDSIHKNAKAFFEHEINKVMPRPIAFEKTRLAETIYGARFAKNRLVIVQRIPLRELAMQSVSPGKTKFDFDYLRKKIKTVRDAALAEALGRFVETCQDQPAWESFCDTFKLRRRDGGDGSRVNCVTVEVGKPDEYREMSKDGTGAWRKGIGSHKGQIIYWNEAGILSVCPVYVHASVAKERERIENLGGKARFYGFFQSDCAVQTIKEIPTEKYQLVVRNEQKQKRRVSATKPLPPCKLTHRLIVTKDSIAELTLANNARVVAKLDVWVEAGLSRI
jgi:CRISPR-associated endonuclease Csn1